MWTGEGIESKLFQYGLVSTSLGCLGSFCTWSIKSNHIRIYLYRIQKRNKGIDCKKIAWCHKNSCIQLCIEKCPIIRIMWWTDASMSPYPATQYISLDHVNHGICTEVMFFNGRSASNEAPLPSNPSSTWPNGTGHEKTADKQCDLSERYNGNLRWKKTLSSPSHQPPPVQKDLGKVEEQKATKLPSQSLILAGAHANLLQKCHFHYASPGLLLQWINFTVRKGSKR